MPDRTRDLAVCLECLRAAGAEVMRRYATFERIEDAPGDISTDADRASQETILQRLAAAFPADRLLGEEATATLAESRGKAFAAEARTWIVDPIDGTRGFARKNGEFSIMLGLVEGERVVLGGVYEPAIDRLTYAVQGEGCHVRQPWDAAPRRCQVRPTAALAEATVAMSRSRKEPAERRLLEILGAQASVKTYSAGIKLAQVARGEADVYLGDYPALKDWDVCAGAILVDEAGGRSSNLAGRPLRFGLEPPVQSGGVFASNGRLHDAALAILAGKPEGMY